MARIVVPGEMVAEVPKPTYFAFVENGKTYSSVLALFDEKNFRLIPLEGAYIPRLDDIVVGVVSEVKFAGYTVDINSPYVGFLPGKELRDELQLGDIVSAKVKEVDEVKNVILSFPRKMSGGEILEILSVKVPRVIGKGNSMLNMIKEATKSDVLVGKNGRVWIRGGNSALAAEAILKIEKEAHTLGLTDRMSAFLIEESKA